MSEPLLLAVDLGSTTVRALALGLDGTVHGRAYRSLETRFPAPGRVEQDAELLWQRALEVLREAAGESRRAGRPAALGVTTQRATAVAWNARTGEPLCPAVGWQDKRARERVASLQAAGLPITSLPSATRFEWWLREDPSVRSAARGGELRLGTPDVWLTTRLTGGATFVTDPGQASCTGLYDTTNHEWSQAALGLFGLERGWLPEVVDTSESVGVTATGVLDVPVPVASRAGDQQAALFGNGLIRKGDAKLSLGTAAVLDVQRGCDATRPDGSPPGTHVLPAWKLPRDSVRFLLEGTVITAGAVVQWLVSLGLLPDPSRLDAVAGQVEDSAGVAFVPALEGLGAPFADEQARGLVSGLTRGTRQAHVVRAALEGIAHRCADTCDALGYGGEEIVADGGLSRSDVLLQTLANFTQRSVLRAEETETAAFGAATLGGLGAGLLPDVHACAALAPGRKRFDPEMGRQEARRFRDRWSEVLALARADSEARGDGGTSPSEPVG